MAPTNVRGSTSSVANRSRVPSAAGDPSGGSQDRLLSRGRSDGMVRQQPARCQSLGELGWLHAIPEYGSE